MSEKKKKKYGFSTYEAASQIRGDWGSVKPVSIIFPDKKKYSRKKKHKEKFENE